MEDFEHQEAIKYKMSSLKLKEAPMRSLLISLLADIVYVVCEEDLTRINIPH